MLRPMPVRRRAAVRKQHVKLFRNGRNQAVRIPREFELPGNDAIMRKEGERLIIEPTPPMSLLSMLDKLSRIDDGLPPFENCPLIRLTSSALLLDTNVVSDLVRKKSPQLAAQLDAVLGRARSLAIRGSSGCHLRLASRSAGTTRKTNWRECFAHRRTGCRTWSPSCNRQRARVCSRRGPSVRELAGLE